MPNKRKKGKKLLAGWYDEVDVEEFKAIASEIGIPASDLLGMLIKEEIKRKRNGVKDEDGSNV